MQYVGKGEKRYDGLAHVTGESRYVDDVYIPNTLTVKALRSDVPKGKVIRIDTSAAEKMSGVAGVITYKDVPHNSYGLVNEQPVLTENVRFKGEPIAAVAAEDEDIALEALRHIKVEIEEEEAVFDPLEAMKPESPKVRPKGNMSIYGDKPYREVFYGDIEAGFREADFTIAEDYFHPALEQSPMEPQICLAVPEARGKLTAYTGSQCLYTHLAQLCSILKLPQSKVRLMGGTVGGAFGGKNDLHAEPIAALLALKTRCPVKWRWTREEEFLYSTIRGAWHISIEDGVKKDGRIVARKMRIIRDSGAYATWDRMIVEKICTLASGPYFIPHVYVRGYCVYTNKPPASAMRGYGITPSTFAVEVQMNKIATMLNMDPWELRFKNTFHNNDETITKKRLDAVSTTEIMQVMARRAGIELPSHLKKMTSAPREVQS